MSDIDGPVCLTRSAPDNSYAGHLLIFDVVCPSVVSRSGVLSSIAEASGDGSVRLPDFVTLAEFKIWSRTITDAEGISDCKDMAHACTVLKAADALDDPCVGDWLDVTVGIVRDKSLAHHRSGGCDLPQEVSAGLSKLPDHLEQRVLEAVTPCHKSDLHLLAAWLDLLPSHHHAAMLSKVILLHRPSRSLSAPADIQSLRFLRALALLPQSPPSLLSLTLDSEMPCHLRSTQIRPRTAPVHDKPAALATALRHHTGLTSLSLVTFCDEASLQAVAPAVATLTALQALHLGTRYQSSIAHYALPLLKVALQPLAALQELKVCIGVPAKDEQPAMRPCHAGSADLCTCSEAPQHCLAELLRTVTALTSLDIVEHWGHQRFTATRPQAQLSLPCLRRLQITSKFHNVASVLLRQLTAPLASLVMRDRNVVNWSIDYLPLAQQLWNSLQKFVQLQSLDIELCMFSSGKHVEDKLLAGAPAALASLSCLHELKFGGEFPIVLGVLRQLAASESGVQRLMVGCGGQRDRPTAETFHELLLSLSRLPLLHLYLSFDRGAIGPAFPGAAALQPLTRLTALRIYSWGSCLRRAEDCGALAGMHQLQSLCISGFSVPPALQADCVRSLGALPALTELALQPHNLTDGLQAAFVQSAPGAGWAALEWLGLFPANPEQAEAIARAVAAFPAFKELMLGDDIDDPVLDQWYGEERYSPELLRVSRIAAGAGFEVEVNWDWARFDWQSAWA